jgi:hypothetical protein
MEKEQTRAGARRRAGGFDWTGAIVSGRECVRNRIPARKRTPPRPAVLGSWPWDNGPDDEALVVRVIWPTPRDNLADTSLTATLPELKRSAKRLVKLARQIERRAGDRPGDAE